jgi:hypothetical protein
MRSQVLLIALLGFARFLPSLQAQPAATRPVAIGVSDPTGAGVAHAQVRLVPPPDSVPAKLETDDQGRIVFNVKPGGYTIFVSAQGFKTARLHVDVTEPHAGDRANQIVPVALKLGDVSSPVPIYPKDSLVITADSYHAPVALSLADFHALPHVTLKVHNGHSNTDETYSGVPLASLLSKVSAPLGSELRKEALTNYLIATGSDGYAVVLSLAEVDPSFHEGQVLVADTRDGQPLGKSGPFELIVSGDKRPARWVHNLESVALQSVR